VTNSQMKVHVQRFVPLRKYECMKLAYWRVCLSVPRDNIHWHAMTEPIAKLQLDLNSVSQKPGIEGC
jgi:hypothetical protein